jgi:hypothetical protein
VTSLIFKVRMSAQKYLFVLASSLGMFVTAQAALAATPPMPDLSGAWRLNDLNSDAVADIADRMRKEQLDDLSPDAQPGAASGTAATPAAGQSGGGGHHGGGGGGHGGKGGGKKSGSDSSTANSDAPPPRIPMPRLFAIDSILIVQQNAKNLQVGLSGGDRMDARLDGIASQSINGTATTQLTPLADGASMTIQMVDGTRFDERWLLSSDGHRLIVTGTMNIPTLKQPISFKRQYDRLD